MLDSLLMLQQMSDSALPIGGYSHSWGLETWVQDGQLNDAEEVYQALSMLFELKIAPIEGSACALAHKAAIEMDNSLFCQLNEYLSAIKWTSESLAASTSMGRRLMQLALDAKWIGAPPPGEQIHHCSAFGWICGSSGLGNSQSVAAYLLASMGSLVSACVRLVPLGHTDGQRILTRLRSDIAKKTAICLDASINDIGGGFAPLHESACVRHENLYSRLFQS